MHEKYNEIQIFRNNNLKLKLVKEPNQSIKKKTQNVSHISRLSSKFSLHIFETSIIVSHGANMVWYWSPSLPKERENIAM